MKHRNWINLLFVFGLLTNSWVAVPPKKSVAQAPPTATILYVNESGSSSNNCSSWTDACDLQTALIKATAGDEIWVAAGTYRPTARNHPADPRSATFVVKPGVALYGGFAGTETGREQRDWQADPTILSGDIGVEGDASDNSYHVVDLNPPNFFTQVSAAWQHACGVTADGSVVCWGNNADGRASPPPGTAFTQVSAGGAHTCGVTAGGTVACWGNNDYDQAVPDAGIFTQVSAGNEHTCGVTAGGTIACWGRDHAGQASPPAGDDFFDVSVGSAHTCAVPNTIGSPPGGYVECWGRNVPWGQATPPELLGPVLQVDAGGDVTCAVDWWPGAAGYVTCWGDPDQGMTSPPSSLFRQVSTSYNLACGVRDDSSAACWGWNQYGQASPPGGSFRQVSASTWYACGIRNDYTVECWGQDIPAASPPSRRFDQVSGGAMLDGFTISGGQANDQGGGLINIGTSPSLVNVYFSDNSATGQGGGLYNQGGSPALANVTFSNNSASEGGGMFNDSSNPTLVNVIFRGNTGSGNGGGMYNDASDPSLANVVFSGNAAGGNGGGMLNTGSNPALVNVTFSGNAAVGNGGGMHNQGGAATLANGILWGNVALTGAQIYNDGSTPTLSFSLVQGSGGSGASWDNSLGTDGGSNIDQDPLFVRQPDPGSDGAWGTPDDDYGDLRLQLASPAIDAGDEGALPADSLDLDGDSDTAERLPVDLDGNPRVLYAAVDMGAYEESCFFSNMAQGGASLSFGREYRAGFHAELDGPASVTISDTLASYDVAGLTPLTEAKQAYQQALACAKTVTQTNEALTGLLDAQWELVTGAMLTGNQELVQALDVEFSPIALDEEMEGLQEAIRWYTRATEGYIPLLAGQHHTRVLALQPTRVDPLTGEETPYLDLQRLALASAKKSRAYLELAERQFQKYTPDSKAQAEQTLRHGFGLATIELTLLEYLWDGAVDDVSYQALVRNVADMQRLFEYLQAGKNPYGYGPEYVPFHFQPKRLPDNNYEQTKTLADVEFEEASTQVQNALGRQQEMDDDFRILQQRLADIGEQYDGQLVRFCGVNASNEPDLARCHENTGGEIYRQLLRIRAATQRLELVQQQMSNQNALIRIEQQRAARVAGIQQATAEMWTETGEKLADLATQEVYLRDTQSEAQAITGLFEGLFSGAQGEDSFDIMGTLAGGLIGMCLAGANTLNQDAVAEDLADVAARRERLQSMQWAQVHYAEAQITNAESAALIKQYMLRFAEYYIEYSIALNNLQQELARLNGMRTQVEYLLAEKAKATAFNEALYQDPAARVLRDYYMELAHDRFEVAMDYAYQAGRALEYEISQEAIFSGGPLNTLNSAYRICDIYTLDAALAQMNTAYHDWLARDDIPSPHLREDVIYLSQALGFEDTYDPDLDRIVTREEKFNAFVRDTANWVDLDQNGTKESLHFTFQTSIYLGNRFFSTRVFNDKIASIKMRVRGQNLGDDRMVIQLKQGGTSFVRAQNAFKHGGPDDIRTYNLPPIEASIMASTNENTLPDEVAVNRELATRSVAFTNWTVTLDMVHEPNNFDLDIGAIEEIELIVAHEAYTLQDIGVSSAQREDGADIFEPPPNRGYRPIETTVEHPLPIASLNRPDSTIQSAYSHAQDITPDLNGTYIGTVVISRPPYMPPLDLAVVLSDTSGSLSGYIDATHGLSYPIVDEDRGPAVSGWWSGNSFYLQSEVFTTVMTTGIQISHQVVLHTGVISDTGEILTGVYSDTLTGLTPAPMVTLGEFKLYRPSHGMILQPMIFLPLVMKESH